MRPATDPSRRARWTIAVRLGRALASLAVIVLVTGALDFALSQACKGRCEFLYQREHRKDYRYRHPVYHHGLVANVSVMANWGDTYYPLRTDSLGFKDRDIRDVPLDDDRFRLLLIGDSFTEGVGVAYEETFAGRLADALAQAGVEILDAGVAATSPAVHYAKVKYLVETLGLRLDHVVVFVDISDIYDEANVFWLGDDDVVHSKFDGAAHAAMPAFGRGLMDDIKANSIVATFVYRLRDWAVYELRRLKARHDRPDRPSALADLDLWRERLAESGEFGWWFDDKAFADWGRRGLERAMGNLDRLHALLGRHGIGMSIAVYPWPNNLLSGDYPSRHETVWRDWANRQGVGFVDLFPVFFGAGDPGKTVIADYFPFDIHWNAQGHRRVADALLPYVRQLAQSKR